MKWKSEYGFMVLSVLLCEYPNDTYALFFPKDLRVFIVYSTI